VKKLSLIPIAAFVALTAFLLLHTSPAQAHEGRDLGLYHVAVGWRVEPAFVGVANGPEIFISMKDDTTKKVEGAEKTLKIEVVFGDKTKELTLSAAYKDPGHYVTNLTPTRPGDYTFHITGKIGDTAVDEKFTSADGKFSSVEPSTDILFPDSNLDAANLQSQIDDLKAQIAALKANAPASK
jgi:hypothetical protein